MLTYIHMNKESEGILGRHASMNYFILMLANSLKDVIIIADDTEFRAKLINDHPFYA